MLLKKLSVPIYTYDYSYWFAWPILFIPTSLAFTVFYNIGFLAYLFIILYAFILIFVIRYLTSRVLTISFETESGYTSGHEDIHVRFGTKIRLQKAYHPYPQAYSFDKYYFRNKNGFFLIDLNRPFVVFSSIALRMVWISHFYQTSFLISDNHVYGWGANACGQIGTLDQPFVTVPQIMTIPILQAGENITSLVSGGMHTLALTNLHRILSWGMNAFGQLGVGHCDDVVGAQEVVCPDLGSDEKFIMLNAHQHYNLALTNEGRIFYWGNKQQTVVSNATLGSLDKALFVTTPTNIQFAHQGDSSSYKQISQTEKYCFALTTQGQLFFWLTSQFEKLNSTSKNDSKIFDMNLIKFPRLNTKETVVQIATGKNHLLALTNHGKVFALGENDHGQRGIPDKIPSPWSEQDFANIVNVETSLKNEKIVKVYAFENISCVLTNFGRILIWGDNHYGQLGDGTIINRHIPQVLSFHQDRSINDEQIIEISMYSTHCVAVNSQGRVLTWGNNTYGQLGNGTTTHYKTPTILTNFSIVPSKETMVQVSVGRVHSLAVTSQGRMYAWGSNDSRQLGDGTYNDRLTPTLINVPNLQSGESIAHISAGSSHSLAVTSQGRVYAWGSNWGGQLGDGTYNDRLTPTLINVPSLQSGESIAHISAGSSHSLAVTTQGRVYAWGYNGEGRLGDGTSNDRSTPTLINVPNLQSGETIIQVTAGYFHSLAVTTQGRVYAWGWNFYGQLGDGTSNDRSTPTLINVPSLQSGETIAQVTAGSSHSLAVTTQARVYSWGSNGSGQLGNGTTTSRNTPTLINVPNLQSGESIDHVSAGSSHSLAVTTQGRVYAWGSNGSGQLGDGTSSVRLTPTLINVLNLQSGETIAQVTAGYSHSLAVTTQGRVYAWGYNGEGQLGDGTNTNRNTPLILYS
jgi:YD repeat-containing protein